MSKSYRIKPSKQRDKLKGTRLVAVLSDTADNETVIALYECTNKVLGKAPICYIPKGRRTRLTLIQPAWLYNIARCRALAKFVHQYGDIPIDFKIETKFQLFDFLEHHYKVSNIDYDPKSRQVHAKQQRSKGREVKSWRN